MDRMVRRNSSRAPSPQEKTTRILMEFLEVAITSIVFLKSIYPCGAFERRRYMNVVVQRARHPQLAAYIHSAVSSLQPFLLKGLIERVVVIFYDKEQIPLEKFVFKLFVDQKYRAKVEENDLEFALRSFLVKLTVSTKPLSDGCAWEITAYFHTLPDVEGTSQDTALWIPTDTKQWHLPPEIIPLKSMDSKPLKVQLYLEHSSDEQKCSME